MWPPLSSFFGKSRQKKSTQPSTRRWALSAYGRSPDSRIILIPGLPILLLREQWLVLEFVPDYSSGGCVRFSRTSLPDKPFRFNCQR